jgi:hypothetical protein
MELYGSGFADAGVEAFFAVTRALVLVVGIGTGIAFLKWRRPRVGLVGIMLIVVIGWAASSYPSYRLYGLQYPGDRLRNLSWCASVAAGHSPFGTGTFGQTGLEPVWPAVVGFLALGRPEWVPHVFRLAPAFILGGLALVLYFHFSNQKIYSEREGDLAPGVRGLLVALFAILLATPTLDFLAPYRGYWAKMFLLKPNHALGLLMIPFLVSLLARNNWPRAALGGLWLGLLGWVFIIHWGFVVAGLVIYILLSAFLKRREVIPESPKFVLALSLGLVTALPYIYLIATHFPHAVTLAKGTHPDFPTRSTWGDMLTGGHSLLFRVTFDLGLVFYLGVIGVVDWVRRKGRGEILWASMVAGAYVLWILNAVLYYTARAREADEFYFFLLFVLSIAAGNGAYRVATVASASVKELRLQSSPASVAVYLVVVFVMATLVFPYWWYPLKMDAHYRASLEPLPRVLTETRDWILAETNPDDVFISGSELGQWIPALTGRRLLYPQREWMEEVHSLVTDTDYEPEWVKDLRNIYVVYDDSHLEKLQIGKDVVEKNPRLVRIHKGGGATFYRLQMDSRDE